MRSLRAAGLPAALADFGFPRLVELAGRLAALDAGSLAQLHPGAADAQRGAVVGLRPLAVAGRRTRGGPRQRGQRPGHGCALMGLNSSAARAARRREREEQEKRFMGSPLGDTIGCPQRVVLSLLSAAAVAGAQDGGEVCRICSGRWAAAASARSAWRRSARGPRRAASALLDLLLVGGGLRLGALGALHSRSSSAFATIAMFFTAVTVLPRTLALPPSGDQGGLDRLHRGGRRPARGGGGRGGDRGGWTSGGRRRRTNQISAPTSAAPTTAQARNAGGTVSIGWNSGRSVDMGLPFRGCAMDLTA